MKIDDILNNLQEQQPVLKDEDAFIDSIMDSLPDIEVEDENRDTKEEGTSTIVIMLRTVSSLAAMLLIGLFIFLNVDNSAKAQQTANNNIQTYGNSYYSEMSKCTTPQEVMKQYADKKQRNINKLISMYNDY